MFLNYNYFYIFIFIDKNNILIAYFKLYIIFVYYF